MSAPTQHTAARIADLLRTNAALVDQYLGYAREYADAVRTHAEAATREVFPSAAVPGMSLIASIPLASTNPQDVEGKLAAVARSGVPISRAYVCSRTFTIYLFG